MPGHSFVSTCLKEIQNHCYFHFQCLNVPTSIFLLFTNFSLVVRERFAILKMCMTKLIKSTIHLDLIKIYKLLRRDLARVTKSYYVLYHAAASIKLNCAIIFKSLQS